jgi:hypothetical protein
MLKDTHHITIRDFSLFEQYNDVKYLCKYKVIPSRFIDNKRLETLLLSIYEHLTEKDEATTKLRKEYHKMKSLYRIQMLMTLYQATLNLMNLIRVNHWKRELGKKASSTENLKYYVKQIEQSTGIVITHESDLLKLKKEIDKWTDKFNENFVKKNDDKKDTTMTFMQVVLGVFAAMNTPLYYKMYLSDFFTMKREAERVAKIRNEQKKKNGR